MKTNLCEKTHAVLITTYTCHCFCTNAREAAELLDVSVSTIVRAIHDGTPIETAYIDRLLLTEGDKPTKTEIRKNKERAEQIRVEVLRRRR